MTKTLRVFVNASPVDVEEGATAADCVRRWNDAEGTAVMAGRRVITDSRGLPIPAETPARAGSIYRTVTSRVAESR